MSHPPDLPNMIILLFLLIASLLGCHDKNPTTPIDITIKADAHPRLYSVGVFKPGDVPKTATVDRILESGDINWVFQQLSLPGKHSATETFAAPDKGYSIVIVVETYGDIRWRFFGPYTPKWVREHIFIQYVSGITSHEDDICTTEPPFCD